MSNNRLYVLHSCGCPEHQELTRNYEGDIKMLYQLGFDGAKYDRCGVQLNSTLYASLMRATGKSFLIENWCVLPLLFLLPAFPHAHPCVHSHWGICTDDDTSSCPTPSRDWCPFNVREVFLSFCLLPGSDWACLSVLG